MKRTRVKQYDIDPTEAIGRGQTARTDPTRLSFRMTQWTVQPLFIRPGLHKHSYSTPLRTKETDGGDPRKLQRSLPAPALTHRSHSRSRGSSCSFLITTKNSNLNGLTAYILRRVSKKSSEMSSMLMAGPNQTRKVSLEKTEDLIVRKIDSMTTRKPDTARKLGVVLI